MTRPAYHVLARRADAAMYTVHLYGMECEVCGDPIAVRVDGASEVEITDPCSSLCHTLSYYPWVSMQDTAIARAAGERQDYLQHLREAAE